MHNVHDTRNKNSATLRNTTRSGTVNGPYTTVQWLVFLLRNRQAPGSNLRLVTGQPDQDLSRLFSLLLGKFWCSI